MQWRPVDEVVLLRIYELGTVVPQHDRSRQTIAEWAPLEADRGGRYGRVPLPPVLSIEFLAVLQAENKRCFNE